jgi:trk system potassium uptake protein TrkH
MVRILLILKYAYRELYKLIHPKAFATVKLQGQVVQKDILESIASFFIFFIGIFVFGSLIMTLLGLDILTATSSVAASIGNIGPGLGAVGPDKNYFFIPEIGKVILMLCMIFGRLEIYTILVLFIPEFWKK